MRPEKHEIQEKKDMRKILGTEGFQKNRISRREQTFEECWKNMIFENMGRSKSQGKIGGTC